jgi:hypothetical protein
LLAVAGYAAARLALEPLREARARRLLGLRPLQWLSLGLLVPSAAALIAGRGLADPDGAAGAAAGAAAAGADLLAPLASAALLVPVMMLFRFLGCDLVFPLRDPPTFPVRLGAIFPNAGGGGTFTATMAILIEPGLDELGQSPFELTLVDTLQDGRVVFESVPSPALVGGDYRATCTVTRPGLPDRVGSCSGKVTGPGLAVLFAADANDPPTSLAAIRCFENDA